MAVTLTMSIVVTYIKHTKVKSAVKASFKFLAAARLSPGPIHLPGDNKLIISIWQVGTF